MIWPRVIGGFQHDCLKLTRLAIKGELVKMQIFLRKMVQKLHVLVFKGYQQPVKSMKVQLNLLDCPLETNIMNQTKPHT